MSDTAMVPATEIESSVTLFGTTDPVLLIERASDIATALAKVIDNRKLFTMISGKKHVRVEGWTFLGSILGVFPCVVRTTELFRDDGKSYGFEAQVEARTRGGEVVGSAIARCTRDERRWASADDYAILSMASTRATSKAMRLPLGWVMTLGGYEATPAEEMDGAFDRGEPPPIRRRAPDSSPSEAPPSDRNGTDDIPTSEAPAASRKAILATIKSLLTATGGQDQLSLSVKAAKIDKSNIKDFTDDEMRRLNAALPECWQAK